MSDNILEIKKLVTSFNTERGKIRAVDDINFTIKTGQTVGIVGESGCGKSVTALSILRLLPKPISYIEDGEIIYKDKDIRKLDIKDMYKIRGKDISMIFQEPMTALNPVHKIGKQIAEIYKLHYPAMNKKEIKQKSIEMITKVGIPDAEQILNDYPHQLSGGMRQRVLIAIALACEPKLLIADEPTTALDVTIQAQILDLIKGLQDENNMSIMFITHDLGVIAEMCDYVVVMYAGKIAEKASINDLFSNTKHPYTNGLLESIPRFVNKRKSKLKTIEGIVPSLFDIPEGCRFQNRCSKVMDICRKNVPQEIKIEEGHYVSCHLFADVR